jgi:ketosteroid isomerase-like protein
VAQDMDNAVAKLREAYDAFNRRDFEAAVSALHPEVEWNRVAEVEGTLHGREAVLQFMQPEVFERQEVEILEISIHGDKILVHSDFLGVAAASGIELRQKGYQLWTIRDGLAAKLEIFLDRAEALRAVEG